MVSQSFHEHPLAGDDALAANDMGFSQPQLVLLVAVHDQSLQIGTLLSLN